MKKLIAFFSYSNNTRKLVNEINKVFNYDIVEIEREIPYSSVYEVCAYKEAKEEIDNNIHPVIKKIEVDYSLYDEILLFFPIWWYTYPMVIATFIDSIKGYKGKVTIFCNSYTNDYKYVENSLRDFKKLDPSIVVKEGLFNKSVKQHIDFISKGE